MISSSVKELVEAADVAPILVDVGSSAGTFPPFAALAPFSMLVGFDADARGQDPNFGRGFKKAILIPKAVVSRESATVDFILTRFGECSSTLEPNSEAVGEYIFEDLFTPIGRATVEATTLNAVLDDLELPRFDWVKVDSQGTDLSLLKSLRESVFFDVLAVDVEPGLQQFYRSEETFCQCHEFMLENGFFLADLNAQSFARVRPTGLEAFRDPGRAPDFADKMKRSPICLEARYFRSISYLEQRVRKDRLLTAFVLAMADDLLGYAMDICLLYERKEGQDKYTHLMQAGIREGIEALHQQKGDLPLDCLSMSALLATARRKISRRLLSLFQQSVATIKG